MEDPSFYCEALSTITDDQNRVVNYCAQRAPDDFGQPREVWSDQSFNGSSLADYLRCAYTMDSGGTDTHRWLAEVKNSWNVKNFMTQQWTATTLVQNDYLYDTRGNRTSNQVSDSHGVIRTAPTA